VYEKARHRRWREKGGTKRLSAARSRVAILINSRYSGGGVKKQLVNFGAAGRALEDKEGVSREEGQLGKATNRKPGNGSTGKRKRDRGFQKGMERKNKGNLQNKGGLQEKEVRREIQKARASL